MAMLTLRLWELTALALPLFVVLVAGIVATYLFCAFVAFRVLGKDYEAAVMTAGFTGFMIGITPNAMASLQELAHTGTQCRLRIRKFAGSCRATGEGP